MPKIRDTPPTYQKEYRFTKAQLDQFELELREAGSFEELMIQKHALERKDGKTTILRYSDIEVYKKCFWTGVYNEPLDFTFNTDVPYVYWSRMYEQIMKERDREYKYEW